MNPHHPYHGLLAAAGRRRKAGPTLGDPYWGQVKLLLHGDGADGSTTFTDQRSHVFTANGNAQIDTAQSKFGGAAMLFDGTGDWIDTPDHADFSLGTSSFTIECWARFNAVPASTAFLCAQCDTGGTGGSTSFAIRKEDTNKIRAFCNNGFTLIGDITGTTTVSTGAWYHLAYVRSGSTFRLYVNGIQEGPSPTDVVDARSVNDSANKLALGRAGEFNGSYFNGWIDEFRMTVGTARYAANFTPPDAAFPNL